MIVVTQAKVPSFCDAPRVFGDPLLFIIGRGIDKATQKSVSMFLFLFFGVYLTRPLQHKGTDQVGDQKFEGANLALKV